MGAGATSWWEQSCSMWHYSLAVDIDQFYEQDERRRSSPELELGRDWHDADGIRYEVSWVEDTGELYVMREPVLRETVDPFGGVHVPHSHSVDTGEVAAMTVAVIGVVLDRAVLDEAVEGWQEALTGANSVSWLVDRLRQHGILGPADQPSHSPSS